MPEWTPEQHSAIVETTGDLLVSASAGTGKTAVLVERIVRLVADAPEPVDLDRFLVVTFTEAAAAEMREKIADALRARLSERPADSRLRRQLLLLENARISTIHAFCLTLIRRHFHRLGLDPEMSVLDEQEALLLRSEVIERVFEDVFEKRDAPRFRTWLDGFGGADPAAMAQGQILALHDFLRSLPDPQRWAERVRADYPLDENGDGVLLSLEAHFWFEPWSRRFLEEVEAVGRGFSQARSAVPEDNNKLGEWVDGFLNVLRGALRAARDGVWGEAVDTIRAFEVPRRPALRKPSPDDERLKGELDRLRVRFQESLQGDLAVLSVDQMCRAHALSAPVVCLLLDLADRFDRAYGEAKRRRCALDFADQEHLALALLQEGEDDDGNPVPSEIARLCHDLYEHVLVDEYQDTSPVQDRILTLASRRWHPERPGNLFAVGDVKQSIYGFRLAAPEIFVEKHTRFPRVADAVESLASNPSPDVPGRRVDLTHNFRSRSCVVDGVNALFQSVMTAEAGDVDYDESAALVARAAYPDFPKGPAGPDTETIVLELDGGEDGESDEDEDWSALEREAALVGQRIRELVGATGGVPMRVLDRDAGDGSTRPVEYRDIVILLRSMRHRADSYARVLALMGIPVYADLSAGYFAAPEVRDMLNLLRVVDNPRQDLPLAALLRSPIFAWSPQDLADVRHAHSGGSFHEAFLALAGSDAEGDVARRARDVAQRIDRWRTLARRGTLADLISRVYDETRYPLTVLGFGSPAIRRANLERLSDLAARFDRFFSRQGLGRFVRFIERLREQESDFGGASPLGEGENAVRIMTIHKSKGLEFPVVFVPDLGKRMNLSARGGGVSLSWHGGMAVRVCDLNRMVAYDSPGCRVLSREARRRAVAEEMRIFYVAATRAREKLILSGGVKSLEKSADRWAALRWVHDDARPHMSTDAALQAGTYLDWLMPVLCRAGWKGQDAALTVPCQVGGPARVRVRVMTGDSELIQELSEREAPGAEPDVSEASPLSPSDEARADRLVERVAWTYPHVALARTPARISASEMRHRLAWGDEEGERAAAPWSRDEVFTYPDPKARDTGSLGAERGSVVHLVMQHLNLLETLDYAGISSQIDDMIDGGILDEERRELVDIESIAAFFDSPLGRRMLAVPPDRVWREVPFVVGVPPSMACDSGLADYDETERVRAQGVIDCLIEESQGLVLIDFKTDAVPPDAVASRAARYASQIRLYSHAVSAIFSAVPCEAWLAFIGPRQNIRMEMQQAPGGK